MSCINKNLTNHRHKTKIIDFATIDNEELIQYFIIATMQLWAFEKMDEGVNLPEIEYNEGNYLEFANDAKLAGVDGLILVDLPIEEDAELLAHLNAKGISTIRLIAPTTPEARVEQILQTASGFVYYISMAGVTGTKNVNPNTIAPYVQLIKKHSKLPVAVGFGIKTPQHARDVSIYSDAVVIGSVLVEKIENYVKTYSSKSAPEKLVEEISEFVASVKNVL
jgi:tryptophan synthase alpha chain